jgi:hypothetical protein
MRGLAELLGKIITDLIRELLQDILEDSVQMWTQPAVGTSSYKSDEEVWRGAEFSDCKGNFPEQELRLYPTQPGWDYSGGQLFLEDKLLLPTMANGIH